MMLTVKNLYCERDERVLFRTWILALQKARSGRYKGQMVAGKTTLLRILCGLNDEFTGEIYWQGKEQSKTRQEFNHEVFIWDMPRL